MDKLVQMGSNGVKWGKMRSNGVKRGQMGSNGLNGVKQGQMGSNGVQRDQNRVKWVKRGIIQVEVKTGMLLFTIIILIILILCFPIDFPACL
jgi:hypothetical protein